MKKLLLAVATAFTLVMGMLSLPAFATNAGSTSGDRSADCDVNWYAKAVWDPQLKNDDPEYPNLMIDMHTGKPVTSWTNGGYINEVRPEYGDPGIFEINHFYGAGNHGVLRYPLATDKTIARGATVTITMPSEITDVVFNGVSTTDRMSLWGTPYSSYTWKANVAALAGSTVNGDGTTSYSVTLADGLVAGTGTVFEFGMTTPGDADTYRFVTDATLRGTYPGCMVAPPMPPAPGPCQVSLAGLTVFPPEASDITVRQKIGSGGEVNADGWGDRTARTLRLYGATDVDLTDVTVVWNATQGFTFVPGSAGRVYTGENTNAMGALYRNGYTKAVQNLGEITITPTQVALHLESMPAKSAFAFNVETKAGADLLPYHLESYLRGTKNCEKPTVTETVTTPGPTVTVTEPGPTTTVTEPGPTATVTQPAPTTTVTEVGPTVTRTATVEVTRTVEVPGPTVTETKTVEVTRTAEVPGPTVTATTTATVTETATATVTATATETTSVPGPTTTETVMQPAPTVTVTAACPDHCGQPGPTTPNLPRTGGGGTLPFAFLGLGAMAGIGISMLRRK